MIKIKGEIRTKVKESLEKLLETKDIQKALWAIDELFAQNKKHNGWVNYETWCLNLWLTNEQTLYKMALSCETQTQLKDLCENLLDVNNEMGLSRIDIIDDFKNSALSEVNFYELFQSFEQIRNENKEYEKANK